MHTMPDSYNAELCGRLHADIDKKLKELDDAVLGKDGLLVRVSNVEQMIPEVRDAIQKTNKVHTIFGVVQTILTPIVVAIVLHFILKK